MTVTALLSLGLSVVFLVVGIPLLLPELSFVLRDPLYVLTIIICTVTLGVAPILDQASIAVRRADLQTWRNTIFAVLKIPFAFVIASVLSGRAGVFLSLTLAWSLSVLVLGFALLPRALHRLLIAPGNVAKYLCAQYRQRGIVFHQFGARADVVVLRVVSPVVVEPILHRLGPILGHVDRRVCSLPKPARHRVGVSRREPAVEGCIQFRHCFAVDDMGELMDENIFAEDHVCSFGQ